MTEIVEFPDKSPLLPPEYLSDEAKTYFADLVRLAKQQFPEARADGALIECAAVAYEAMRAAAIQAKRAQESNDGAAWSAALKQQTQAGRDLRTALTSLKLSPLERSVKGTRAALAEEPDDWDGLLD